MKKIVLLCAAGMSTSLLVTKMREAAATEGYECEINAYPVSQSGAVLKDADCCLLGPQARFNLKKVQAEFPNLPCAVIEMQKYGTMDGKGVLADAKALIG
ncbi:PTS sugar transporter subunit IIB [Anaerorhabdus sp.]|uniref:PTS sugar transporter subunit IIB n=1 Tax=Anaerorhabdus sp. TaxID=1872524 RepID=UPI002FC86B6D